MPNALHLHKVATGVNLMQVRSEQQDALSLEM